MQQIDEHDFAVDGMQFRARPLKVRDALRGETILAEGLLPLIASGEGFTFSTESLRGLGRIGELVDLLVPTCKVQWEGKWVELAPFLDAVFARKPAALIAWLFDCVGYQYADFFGGNGPALVKETVSRLISRLGWTGASGDSPPTDGSKTH